MSRLWREYQDKVQLMAPMRSSRSGTFCTYSLQFPELLGVLDAGGPELLPYQGLAELWDDYAAAWTPNYPEYVRALARREGRELRTVLDLACGSGSHVARLAEVADEVVGLDASEPMLDVARRRVGDRPGVSFVGGDFRDFDLGRTFDSVVCACNSLNYVADQRELEQVFSAVARHLNPGGIFLFDAFTACGMAQLSGRWIHTKLEERRMVIRLAYEPEHRREMATVLLQAGIETHQRAPIDRRDVSTAAAATGMVVIDQFSSALPLSNWGHADVLFHVLKRDRLPTARTPEVLTGVGHP